VKLLFPPEDQAPEAWLQRYSKPQILGDWPASPNMAVVAVWEVEDWSEGWVCLSQAELDNIMEREEPVLYFHVPKDVLLRPGICPDLTKEMFNEVDPE